MGFSNLDSAAGLAILNDYLTDKSYIEGWNASQADVAVFEALNGAPDAAKNVHAARWYSHIKSMAAAFATLPGTKKAASEYGPTESAKPAAKKDDDLDLFGSDDEEEDAEAEAAKAARLAEYQAKKAKKPTVIAKSSVILDVKPWDDETDMKDLEKQVRGIALDGLLWGASELVAIGYGIKKLRISCVIEDDKVGTDLLEDQITSLDDLVQSMDVYSFNKI